MGTGKLQVFWDNFGHLSRRLEAYCNFSTITFSLHIERLAVVNQFASSLVFGKKPISSKLG